MISRKHAASFVIAISLTLWPAAVRSDPEDAAPAFDPARKFPAEKLREDFTVFREALKEGHPGLYRYSTKEKLDETLTAVFNGLNEPLTEFEFLRRLQPLVASIGCTHTYCLVSEAADKWLKEQPVQPPVKLKISERKAYVVRSSGDDPPAPGSELVVFNGQPVADIIPQLLPFLSVEGRIDSARQRYAEDPVRFGLYTTVLLGPSKSFTMKYIAPGGDIERTAKLAGVNLTELMKLDKQWEKELGAPSEPISLGYREGIPVLTIRSLKRDEFSKSRIDYPALLQDVFRELNEKSVPALIVDLRDNEGGGSANTTALLAHFLDQSFQHLASMEVKKHEYDFFRYARLTPDQRRVPEHLAKPNDHGTLDITEHPTLGMQDPTPPVYNGRVYLLINGRTSSAAAQFVALMHFHQRAKIIGAEGDIDRFGSQGGWLATLSLPNTKARVQIPLMRLTLAVSGDPANRRIVPDYPVETTIDDIVAGRDPVMQKAMALASTSE